MSFVSRRRRRFHANVIWTRLLKELTRGKIINNTSATWAGDKGDEWETSGWEYSQFPWGISVVPPASSSFVPQLHLGRSQIAPGTCVNPPTFDPARCSPPRGAALIKPLNICLFVCENRIITPVSNAVIGHL